MSAPQTRWRLNGRFTAIFFGSLLAFAVFAYFWHGWQVSSSTELLWQRAQEQEKKEEWEELTRTLRRYLQAAPEDDKGWHLFAVAQDRGATSFEEKDAAARVVKRVVARPGIAKDVALRLRLARLLYESGQAADAITEAERVIQGGSPEQVREATIVAALAFQDQTRFGSLAQPDWDATRSKLEHALTLQPSLEDDVELTTGLASLYRNENATLSGAEWSPEKRAERAEELMNQLVARHPNDSSALLARYRYRVGYKIDGAEEDLAAATKNADEEAFEVWLTAGEGTLRGDVGDPAVLGQAAGYFRKAITASPKDRRGYLGLVRTLIFLESVKPDGKSIENAEQVLQDGLKELDENDFELQLWLARVNLTTRDDQKLKRVLANLDRIRSQNSIRWVDAYRSLAQIETLRLQAEAHMNASEYAKAIELIQQIISIEGSLPAGSVEQVAWATPTYRTWMMLGQCREALGEMDLAARAYETGLTLTQDQELLRAVARAWTAAGRADLAAPYRQRFSTSDDPLADVEGNIRGLMSSAKSPEDWQAILDLNEDLKKDPARALSAWLLEAQVRQLLNDLPAAMAALRSAEATNPTTPFAWRSLAMAYTGLASPADAQRCIAKYAALAPPQDVALLRAELLTREQQFAAAEQVLRKAIEATPASDRLKVQLALMRLLLGQARTAEAKAVLSASAESGEMKDREALRLLAEISLAESNFDEVERLEKKIKTLDDETGTQWKYIRARRLLAMPDGDRAEATTLSAELSVARPDWLDAAELAGMVAEKNGETTDALRAYERALNLASGTASETRIGNRYVELALKAGRGSSLPVVVKSTLVNSRSMSLTAISRCVAEGNNALALQLASEVAKVRPNDPLSYYWYGQVLAVSGQMDAAATELRKACQMAPGSPLAWDALLNVLVSSGDAEAAKSAVASLEKNSALSEPGKSLLLARAQEAVGNAVEAAKLYISLVENHGGEPDVRTSAIAFFLPRDPVRAEQLARDGLKEKPEDRLLQRQLAAAVGARGTAESLTEAAALLGAKEGQLPLEEVDQRTYAQMLTKRPERDSRRRGAQILATLAARKSSVPSQERLALVRLYETDANHPAAIEQLRQLVDRSPLVVPDHLVMLADYVADHYGIASSEDRLAAKNAVAALQQQEGDSWRVFALELRLQALENQAAESPMPLNTAALIKDRVNRDLPSRTSPQDKAALLVDAAQLHQEFKNATAAEECFRQAAELFPTAKLALAGFLSQEQDGARLDEAIDLCIAAAPQVGDVQAARGVATVLTLGGPSDAQKQRAEAWLRPILDAHPNDPALLFSWGSYCLVSGAQDEAVKALRNVLRFSPDNTLARNNLAYLLVSEGKPDEALEQVNRAIALAGPTKSFRDTRGLALMAAKRHDEAVQVFRELVEESPEDPVVRLHLAAAELAAGHESEAREQLERAESLELHEAKLPAFDRQSLASLRSAVGS